MDLELVARTSAILLASSVIAALLRRAAPSTRHLVWHFAIVAVLLTPFLAPLAPTIKVPWVPEVPGVPKGFVLNAVPSSIEPIVEPVTGGTQQNDAFGTLGTIATFGTAVIGAWVLFCWALSAFLLAGIDRGPRALADRGPLALAADGIEVTDRGEATETRSEPACRRLLYVGGDDAAVGPVLDR